MRHFFFLTTYLSLRLLSGLDHPNIVCLSSCALLVSQIIVSGLLVLHDAVTVLLDAGDYLHHGIVHSDLMYARFPLSHSPPFTYLKDLRTSAITSTTPIVISSSSTLACKSISHSWLSFVHLFTQENSCILPTTNSPLSPALLVMSSPKSSKTPTTKNWSTSLIASTRIHRRNTSSLLSLCTATTAYVPLCGYLSFDAENTTPSRMRLQIKFRGPYWNLFPIKPSPSSDVLPSSICSIVPPLRRLYVILGLSLPPPTRHPTSISPPPSGKTRVPRLRRFALSEPRMLDKQIPWKRQNMAR